LYLTLLGLGCVLGAAETVASTGVAVTFGATGGTTSAVLVDTSGVLAGKSLVAVSQGSSHTLALASDGKVYAWGNNFGGCLGNPIATGGDFNYSSSTPIAVDTSGVLSGKTIVAIAAGVDFSLALGSDGKVYSWGSNSYDQLGDGTSTNQPAPVAVVMSGALSGKTVTAIAAGDLFALALTSDGQVYSWGDSDFGRLGVTATNAPPSGAANAPIPVDTSGVMAGKIITAIACGRGFSLALSSDSKIFGWGLDPYGQLGNGSVPPGGYTLVPVATDMSGVLSGLTITSISCAGYHSVALATNGRVYAWGNDEVGQLGDAANTTDRLSPVAVDTSAALNGVFVTSISTGKQSSFALSSTGLVYAWGANSPFNSLGIPLVNGSAVQTNVPMAMDTSGVLNGMAVTALQSGSGGGDAQFTIVIAAFAGAAPVITTNPTSQSITAGSNATFVAAASGNPTPVAQWQQSTDGGATFTNIVGATSTTLQLTAVPASANGNQYRAVFTNTAGSATTSAATLTVSAGPVITTNPVDVTVNAGGAAVFTAAASGVPAPTVQWQFSTDGGATFSNVAGATTTTLTVPNALAGQNGTKFRAVYTNASGTATTTAATMTVNFPPSVTTNPTSQSITAGSNATFVAAASGNPTPVVQWQQSTDGGATFTNIAGATSTTLQLTAVPASANGNQYRAVFTNTAGSAITSAATLTVTAVAPTPPAAPTANAATAVTSVGFTANWGSVSGAAGYRLDVSTSNAFSSLLSGYSDLDVGNVLSQAVSGLSASTPYYYRARAYNSGGTSGNSNTITVTTVATIVVTTPLTVSTLAGQPVSSGSSDGTGSAARFYYPSGLATDNIGNLYVADTDNNTIRKIVASTGAVTTLAGLAGSSGSADGTGSAARFNNPAGVAVDSAGNVYVADTLNHTLRRITSVGVVSTLAGSTGVAGSADGTGTAARFRGPQGLAIDSGSNLYVADTNNHTIRKVVPSTGVVTTVAGFAGNSGSTDGLGSQARFNYPSGVAVDATGNLFVADTENDTIRQIVPSGQVSTLAGLAGASGVADGTGSAALFDSPSDLAVDGSGNLYVADTDNFTIRKVAPSTGVVSTIAGLGGTSGSADGLGSAVRFFHPAGIAMDSSSNLYVADTNNDTIRVGLLPAMPAIQTQPQSQTVTAGSSVLFSVTAAGRPAVTYQWYFGGTAIAGATSSSYSISNAQSGNAGNYTVVVSNIMGTVTSNQATLTVNPAGGGGGGGGGGGAPSIWFYGLLSLLALARRVSRR
jgi:alpha-tubulin suppressor-like RCC1 family protein